MRTTRQISVDQTPQVQINYLKYQNMKSNGQLAQQQLSQAAQASNKSKNTLGTQSMQQLQAARIAGANVGMSKTATGHFNVRASQKESLEDTYLLNQSAAVLSSSNNSQKQIKGFGVVNNMGMGHGMANSQSSLLRSTQQGIKLSKNTPVNKNKRQADIQSKSFSPSHHESTGGFSQQQIMAQSRNNSGKSSKGSQKQAMPQSTVNYAGQLRDVKQADRKAAMLEQTYGMQLGNAASGLSTTAQQHDRRQGGATSSKKLTKSQKRVQGVFVNYGAASESSHGSSAGPAGSLGRNSNQQATPQQLLMSRSITNVSKQSYNNSSGGSRNSKGRAITSQQTSSQKKQEAGHFIKINEELQRLENSQLLARNHRIIEANGTGDFFSAERQRGSRQDDANGTPSSDYGMLFRAATGGSQAAHEKPSSVATGMDLHQRGEGGGSFGNPEGLVSLGGTTNVIVNRKNNDGESNASSGHYITKEPRSAAVNKVRSGLPAVSASAANSISVVPQTSTTAGRRIQRFDEPDSEKQERLRVKKKLLMSDSLQMLTKHRNNQLQQQLHGSINKSLKSGTNVSSSNQSKEREKKDSVVTEMNAADSANARGSALRIQNQQQPLQTQLEEDDDCSSSILLSESYPLERQSSSKLTASQVELSQTAIRQPALQINLQSKAQGSNKGLNAVDRQNFAEKLQKVQHDLQVRNHLQEQRERELSQLERDVQDQMTDHHGRMSTQQSVLESSSRELTFQLKELERITLHAQLHDANARLQSQRDNFLESTNPNATLQHNVSFNGSKGNLALQNALSNRVNKQYGTRQTQGSLNTERQRNFAFNTGNGQQLVPPGRASYAHQNYVGRHATPGKGGPLIHQGLAPLKPALVADELGRRAAAGDDGIMDQKSTHSNGMSLRLHSGANSARNGGGNSHRSQKRGNKNINQKELRQRRANEVGGHGSSRLSSTPRGAGLGNGLAHHGSSQFLAGPGGELLDYGAGDVHDPNQITPTVKYQSQGQHGSLQPNRAQGGMKIPNDIKMKPLNLQQFQKQSLNPNMQLMNQNKSIEMQQHHEHSFNFHGQLSSSRLSGTRGGRGAKLSARDAETERKGKPPCSSRNSSIIMGTATMAGIGTGQGVAAQHQRIMQTLEASQTNGSLQLKINSKNQSNLTNILPAFSDVVVEANSSSSNMPSITPQQQKSYQPKVYKASRGSNMNQEGTVQIANADHNCSKRASQLSAYGSGSKRGLNSRNLMTSASPSPSPSMQDSKKSMKGEEQQIYMTIGQADPHPSQKTQNEMSASRLEQSQQSQKSAQGFNTIGADSSGRNTWQNINNDLQNEELRVMRARGKGELERPQTATMKMQVGSKKIKINELKTSPRHKVLTQINHDQPNAQGLRMKLKTIEMENGATRVVDPQVFHSLEHNRGGMLAMAQSQQNSNSKQAATLLDTQNLSTKPQTKPMETTQGLDPRSPGRSLNNMRPLKTKSGAKQKKNALEFQMTSAGQYKLVKVKNRSQDPKQVLQTEMGDAEEESKASGAGRPDDSYLMNIDWKNQSMTQAAHLDGGHVGGRQLKDSNRGFNVVVVRKQKDSANSIQQNEEQAPQQKLSGRLHPGRKNYDANPNYAKSLNQDAQQNGKRANSTQSDQMKRSKINASQLFDSSFLCCLTNSKSKF